MSDSTRTVLVTGATGFVGTALLDRLRRAADLRPRAATRRTPPGIRSHEVVNVGSISGDTDWSAALGGVDVVVHLAARVHVMHDTAADPLSEFRAMNVVATRHLARQAARAGVRRFVYLSSIKVNGEDTMPGRPFTERDVPAPQDAYGISKHEGELALAEVAMSAGMEYVIIRPPLVYGPGVRANFRSMMRWVHRGIPLPLGAIRNRRSLVGLDNLVDLIVTTARHPMARNRVFLAGDGEDLSTTQLLRRLGYALGRPARLLPVPEPVLKAGLGAIGRGGIAQRLCGSLQVDISATREALGWKPPLTVEESLKRTAMDFLGSLQTIP